jgi:hypothetical protein
MKGITRKEKLNLQIGDIVIHSIGKREEVLIENIIHQDHGIKNYPEDYCRINGSYWNYDDIIEIIKNGK